MRMSNDRDQALLRSAVSDAAANLLAFVPSLGTREALAFGVGVPLPTRFRFAELPAQSIPRSEALADKTGPEASGQDLNFIVSVVERWRGATVSQRKATDEPLRELKPIASPAAPPIAPQTAPPAQPAQAAENRFGLLRKPLGDRPDAPGTLRRPTTDRPDPISPLRNPPPGHPHR
jgi:hypothetical protein